MKPLVFIGGSGVDDIDGLAETRRAEVGSPFGKPSDAVRHGTLGGQPAVFLPRHGRGHAVPPSRVNFRANESLAMREDVDIAGGGRNRQGRTPFLALRSPSW